MKRLISLCSMLYLTFLITGCNAQKNNSSEVTKNKEAISAFYQKALTVNKETQPTTVLTPLMAENYTSSNSSGAKGAKELMGQLEFFWKLIPDLKWDVQQVINNGDQYVVRSIATGTPNGNFMGLQTDGSKSFKIMTIDVHTMKDGKFVNTNHIEDWTTAMQQLKPKNGASDETMKVAMEFMGAMGKGDMKKMMDLMHDDMVWHNEGDKSLPWIGPWKGKKTILEKFLPSFGSNFKTIKWEPSDALSKDNTAAFFGKMIGKLTKSNKKTEEFTYALRVKVKDGKVILWNWFEDSYAVSKAYHNK
ncbi:nuclear transport factor 2 family protein [uncultured Tenacibaculum sp.]|uniref:nuclear transport factor 2 family protein n=1 Tax=uncultured Tenacibaculum sp. TaxID=174713 RepID=UPI002634A9B4|nr:nuclear transport factor 2 family protein [uncultured Tenacibaculum sp.]